MAPEALTHQAPGPVARDGRPQLAACHHPQAAARTRAVSPIQDQATQHQPPARRADAGKLTGKLHAPSARKRLRTGVGGHKPGIRRGSGACDRRGGDSSECPGRSWNYAARGTHVGVCGAASMADTCVSCQNSMPVVVQDRPSRLPGSRAGPSVRKRTAESINEPRGVKQPAAVGVFRFGRARSWPPDFPALEARPNPRLPFTGAGPNGRSAGTIQPLPPGAARSKGGPAPPHPPIAVARDEPV